MGTSRLGLSGRRGVIAGAMIAVAGATSLTGCGSARGAMSTMTNTAAEQHAQVVRKSASGMTPAEIDRFERDDRSHHEACAGQQHQRKCDLNNNQCIP